MAEKNETELMKAIGIAVAIVILGVISALVVAAILDSSVFDGTQVTGTNTNESLGAMDNITNETFAIISTQPNATCTLDNAYNSTGGEVILSGNYTFYGSDCKMILTNVSEYIGEGVNVTYGFTYIDESGLIIDVDDVASLFGEFIDGLLGFLGIIGIVLGVIWLIMYVAKLFSKGGLNDLGQTA